MRNLLRGKASAQYGSKGENMTHTTPPLRSGFRPDDYGSRLREISDENQSMHLTFIIHVTLFPLQHHCYTSLNSAFVLSSAFRPSCHPPTEPFLLRGIYFSSHGASMRLLI